MGKTIRDWVRPNILAMAGYTPGEQPDATQRIIKLNTNENPYPPSAPVLTALHAAIGEQLRRYPEPSARPVREAAARRLGVDPDGVVVGNGSDDLLTMLLRTFVDPGDLVTAPEPTYSLYAPLVQMQGGHYKGISWTIDGNLPIAALAECGAKLIFVTRPNAPTGHAVPLKQVAALCQHTSGVVVLDEAYGDFAEDNGIPLLADHPNLIITRTFSKSLSLAGMRIGLGFMDPALARELHKVRDSYNVDALAQAAAAAALNHWPDYLPFLERIKSERTRLRDELLKRGFDVPPSQANFLLATVPNPEHNGAWWLEALRKESILVRYFGSDPRLRDKIRITIGTPEEMDSLLEAVDRILTQRP